MKTIFKLSATCLLLSLACFQARSQTQYHIDISGIDKGKSIKSEKIENESFVKIELNGFEQTFTVGEPELPVKYVQLLMPQGQTVDDIQVDVNQGQRIKIDSKVLPVQPPIPTSLDYIKPDFANPDNAIYDQDNLFPATNAEIVDVGKFDGNTIVTIAIYPIRYNPKKQVLQAYSSISVSLNTKSDGSNLKSTKQITRSIQYKSLYEDALGALVSDETAAESSTHINYIDYSKMTNLKSTTTPYEYVVVTSESLAPAFTDFVNWKRERGINIGIVSLEEIYANYSGDLISGIYDNAGKVRQYLKDAYDRGLVYCLLGGDNTVVPIRYGYAGILYTTVEPIPTDIYFSDFDGDWYSDGDTEYGEYTDDVNFYPEIFVGRVLCKTSADVQRWTEKVIRYEKNPGNGNYDYLKKCFNLHMDEMQEKDEGRKFQEHLPFFQHVLFEEEYPLGTPSFAYGGLPAFPKGADAINEIKKGYGFINWNSHANPTILTCASTGINHSPYYAIFPYDAKSLSGVEEETGNGMDNIGNIECPAIFYTEGCTSTPFDNNVAKPGITANMGQGWTTYSTSGGPVYVGNTREGVVGPFSMTKKFTDIIALDHIYNLGVVEGLTKSKAGNYGLKYTHNIIGCPELRMWSDIPKMLNPMINWTSNNVEITTDQVNRSITVMSANDNGASYYRTVHNTNNEIFSTTVRPLKIIIDNPHYLPYIYNSGYKQGLPYYCNFNSGSLDGYWNTRSSNALGRIQITTANGPRSGYHMTMDVRLDGISVQNYAYLHLNLLGYKNVKMTFYYKDFSDEYDPGKDAIWLSDDGGNTWVKVYDLSGSTYSILHTVDISEKAKTYNLILSDNFIVRFGQYDNFRIPSDGMAFDDISVTGTKSASTTPTYIGLPFSEGFEGEQQQHWRFHSSSSEGRIEISEDYSPIEGKKHLLLNASSDEYAYNYADLYLSMYNEQDVVLAFQWKDFGDETHSADGIYLSTNGGASFNKLFSFNGGSYPDNTWRKDTIHLNDYGYSLTTNSVIRFEQYDNYSINIDGIAIDDIKVYRAGDEPVTAYKLPVLPVTSTIADAQVYSNINYSGSEVTNRPELAPGTNDVWFEVTVPESGNIEFLIDGIDNINGVFDTYEYYPQGDSFFYKENLYIDDLNNNILPDFQLRAQNAGEKLYIRFWTKGAGGRFKLVAKEEYNDNPCNAVTIKNFDQYYFSSSHSYDGGTSNVAETQCSSFNGYDRWYRVKVPNTGRLKVNVEYHETTDPNWFLAAYRADNCAVLYEITCDETSGPEGLPEILLEGETPGDIIYFRVWEDGERQGKFKIIATEPSYSQICDAVELPVYDKYTPIHAHVDWSATSTVPDPPCENYYRGNAWFRTTIPEDGILNIETRPRMTNDNAVMAVYSGTCSSPVFIECDDDDGYDFMPYIHLFRRPPGQEIFIRVWPYDGEDFSGAFNISAYRDFNDIPCAARELIVGDEAEKNHVYGSTYSATRSYIPYHECMYETPDVWYKVVVPATGKLTIEIDEDIPNRTLSLYSSNDCAVVGYPFACYWFNEDYSMIKLDLDRTPGETIYIRLSYDIGEPGSAFRICAYEPTGYNDEPCIPITLGIPSKIKADLYHATNSPGVPAPRCGAYNGDDIWFKTTVPANGCMIIEGKQYPNSEFYDGAMAVYKGTCGSLTLVECDDDDGEGFMPRTVFTNRYDLANKDIYIRFWHWDNDYHDPFYFVLKENVGMDPIFKSADEVEKIVPFTDIEEYGLRFYPNPANNFLTVELAEGNDIMLQIVNALGQVIQTYELTQTEVLDIRDFKEGIYILNAIRKTGEDITQQKGKLVISR